MTTPKNSSNNRNSNTSAKTYTGARFGNDHGSISFGQIHQRGDVIADVVLQASDGTHAIVLDKNGERKGWTTITSPGNFQVRCAFDKGRAKDQSAMMICADNGDINIVARNGKIRLEADDIELVARGEKTSEGNIRLNAREAIVLDGAKKVLINSTTFTQISSSGKLELVANGFMKLYGSLIQGVTDAVSSKDSKVGGQSFQKQQILQK